MTSRLAQWWSLIGGCRGRRKLIGPQVGAELGRVTGDQCCLNCKQERKWDPGTKDQREGEGKEEHIALSGPLSERGTISEYRYHDELKWPALVFSRVMCFSFTSQSETAGQGKMLTCRIPDIAQHNMRAGFPDVQISG